MVVVYGEVMPNIEIRGDHAFVGPTATGDTICYPLGLFRQTHRRMGAVIAMHDAKPNNVEPLRRSKRAH